MVATCLLALTPCGRSYSVDRWRALQRGIRQKSKLPLERGPLWGTRLIALQISLVYFWSAYAKATKSFYTGERMEDLYMYYFFGSDYPTIPGFHELMVVISVGAILLECLLAVGLWFPRFQKWLIPAGIFLHLVFYYTLDVWTFSVTVILLYLVYVPPDTVHRVIDQMSGVDVPTRRGRS